MYMSKASKLYLCTPCAVILYIISCLLDGDSHHDDIHIIEIICIAPQWKPNVDFAPNVLTSKSSQQYVLKHYIDISNVFQMENFRPLSEFTLTDEIMHVQNN